MAAIFAGQDGHTLATVDSVLICGYYGHGNAGDELILDVLLSDIEIVLPGAAVSVVTDRAEAVRSERGIAAIPFDDIEALVDAATAARLIVLGGGGLLHEYQPADETRLLRPDHWGLAYYAGVAALGPLVGTPVALYGIGIGPIATGAGERLLEIAVRSASAVAVRDRGSRGLAVEAGARHVLLAADPVLNAGPPQPAEQRGGLGVVVRPWERGFDPVALAAAVDGLAADRGWAVEFLAFQSPEDGATAQTVIDAMSTPASVVAVDRTELATRISRYEALIGMRLHSLVLGAITHTPQIGLAYDPKVSALMDELGSASACVDLADLTAEPLGVALEAARLGSPPGLEGLRQRALLNRNALSGALERGPVAPAAGGLLVGDRLRLVSELEQKVAQLTEIHERLAANQDRLAELESDYQRWAGDYQAILDSRAYRVVKKLWALRSRLGGGS